MSNNNLFMKIFLYNLSQKLNPITRLNFYHFYPSFITDLEFQDFKTIKITLDYLLANSKITKSFYDVFVDLFLKQSVDLNTL